LYRPAFVRLPVDWSVVVRFGAKESAEELFH